MAKSGVRLLKIWNVNVGVNEIGRVVAAVTTRGRDIFYSQHGDLTHRIILVVLLFVD